MSLPQISDCEVEGTWGRSALYARSQNRIYHRTVRAVSFSMQCLWYLWYCRIMYMHVLMYSLSRDIDYLYCCLLATSDTLSLQRWNTTTSAYRSALKSHNWSNKLITSLHCLSITRYSSQYRILLMFRTIMADSATSPLSVFCLLAYIAVAIPGKIFFIIIRSYLTDLYLWSRLVNVQKYSHKSRETFV